MRSVFISSFLRNVPSIHSHSQIWDEKFYQNNKLVKLNSVSPTLYCYQDQTHPERNNERHRERTMGEREREVLEVGKRGS